MSKPKQHTRMEVDGIVVEIKPLDLEVQYTYSDGTPHYRQRSLYEVQVDGVKRGYVMFPSGWGGQWEAYSLRPKNIWNPETHDPASELRQFGVASYYRALSPGALKEPENWGEHERRWADRNAILQAFPKMVALGRCPSPEEELKIYEKAKRDKRLQAAEEAARKEQWARERAESEEREARERERAEEERVETLEGLESLKTKYWDAMTNLEMVALTRAIQKFGGQA